MGGLSDTVTVFIWFLVTKSEIGFLIIKIDLQAQLQDFCLFFYYFRTSQLKYTIAVWLTEGVGGKSVSLSSRQGHSHPH